MASKILFFVAVALCTISVQVQAQADPPCSPFEEQLYYPHPDCTKYYVCSFGVITVGDCPGGLFWNPEIDQCDFDFNVEECVGGTRPPTGNTTSPTTRPSTTTTRPPTTTTRPTTTTTRPTTTTTRPTTRPTTTTTRPTTTTTRSSTTTPPRTTTPLPNGCPPTGVDKIPYPGSCTLYFICIEGVPHMSICADGLYFNPVVKECDRPYNVNCTEPTTTTLRPNTTTTTLRPNTTVTTTTLRPNTTTTTLRPTTTNATTIRPTTRNETSQTEPVITSTTPDPDLFPCPALPFVYVAHPTECSKYYACANGVYQRMYICSFDYWFRQTLQSCVAPWSDTCDQ